MAEGTSTFMGRGVGLSGNYQIVGDNDTDDTLTITGASSSAAGDILVVQNSTGTEFLVVSSSGLVTIANTGSLALSAGVKATISSSASQGIVASMTSTGALAAGAYMPSGFTVLQSSKAVIESAFLFDSASGATSAYAGTAQFLLACHGSKAPSYFLNVGVSSTFAEGAAADNGFFNTATSLASSISYSTITPFASIAVMSGSYVFYIPCYPSTGVVVA